MKQPETPHNWEVPQRQSPAAIFILLLKTAVTLLKAFWPALLILFFRKRDEDSNLNVLYILLGFALLTLITTILNYLFYKFHIRDGNLVINSGFFKRKTLTLPLRNIIAVHLEQNLWQQVLKVVRVSMDSAGSEKMEVKIDALSVPKAEELRSRLLMERMEEQEVAEDEAPVVHRLHFTDLLKLSISANHLEAFFILFTIGINLVDDIGKILNIDGWAIVGDFAGKYGEAAWAVSIMFFLVAIVSVIVSMVRTMMRFYDFRLQETSRGWKIGYGLLNRVQKVVPYNKIQILSWRANLLRRKLNLWVIRVHSAGAEDTKRKQQVSMPVTSLATAAKLSRVYMASPLIDPEGALQISKAYGTRRMLLVALPVAILVTIIFLLISGLPGLGFLLLFPAMSWYYMLWRQRFRYSWNEEGLQLISGVWGRRYTLLSWKKIQQTELRQSIYQRRRSLATLRFVTAGGTVNLPFISHASAIALCDSVLYYVESREEGWM